MHFRRPTPEVALAGARAMKTIALADGTFADTERNLIASALHFFGVEADVEALPTVTPEELAAAITDPAIRQQLVRGMVVTSVIDGEASPAESALVDRFAHALEVASPDLRTLRLLAEESLVRARLDLARRFWARERAIAEVRAKGVGWLARSLAAMAGIREDPAMSARYRALADLPAGTLGHGYVDFIRSNGFSFPGEAGSPIETIVLHDLTHVLSGYGTTPLGELQVLSFHAGCRREEKDPFSFVMFGIAEFQLGIAVTPVAQGSKGALDPALMLRALERGSKCRIDPTDGWDPWPVMAVPLAELRERYGIEP